MQWNWEHEVKSDEWAPSTTYRYNCHGCVNQSNLAGTTSQEYYYDGLGGGIGSIICRKEGSDYYYFHYNHKGDVISFTDADKEEVAYYEYDA